MSSDPTPSAENIKEAIRSCYAPKVRDFIWFEELRVGTGYGGGRERRIDMWGICGAPSNARRTVAIEVKVSASDFSRDKNNPQKRRGALLHSNQFFYAAPKGIINPKNLPPECGLIEVRYCEYTGRYNRGSHWVADIAVDAPFEERFPPDWSFVASVCRQLTAGEGADPV